MKFLVDEDLPRSTVALLKELEWEAADVRDIGLRGHSDGESLLMPKRMAIVLLPPTADLPILGIPSARVPRHHCPRSSATGNAAHYPAIDS